MLKGTAFSTLTDRQEKTMKLKKIMAIVIAVVMETGILGTGVSAANTGNETTTEAAGTSLGDVRENSLTDTVTDDGTMMTTGDESLVNRDNGMDAKTFPSAYALKGADASAKSDVNGRKESTEEAGNVGSAYRMTGQMTDMVNQSGSSLCWAISALDSAQINLGKGGSQIFSPYHLACSAFAGSGDTWNLQGDTFISHGGNFQIAGSTLARWYGAASMKDYPDNDAMTLTESRRQTSIAHLTSLERLTDPNPGRSTSSSRHRTLAAQTAADVKAQVSAGNAVCFDYTISGYRSLDGRTVLYHSTYQLPTHQSIIVGWNDDVPTGAPSNGAYLVKNTWGSDWGDEDDGYLWVSYYDRSITNPCVYHLEYADNGKLTDQDIYSYDGTGFYAYLTADTGESFKSANVFSASNNETIDHVGIYVPAGGHATLTVRTGNALDHGGMPDEGRVVSTASTGTKTYAGFYVIALNHPVTVQKSRRFAVECVTKNASGHDMAYFEYSKNGDESGTRTVTSNTGETYCTSDEGDYIDIRRSDRAYLGNACIKAYGTTTDATPVRYTTSLAKGHPYLTAAEDKEGNKPMYRMYNPNSGEHFYTDSSSERNRLFRVGWNEEGIGWYAPTKGTPVYRLYNPNAGDHHYTTSAGERKNLVKLGWRYEGVGWYSGGNAPLYRQYNPNARAGAHNYTLSKGENDRLVKLGWRDEGIAWYGYA